MISRRDVLKVSGLLAASTSLPVWTQTYAPPDYKLTISRVTLELSRRHRIDTTVYNGQAPGPLLQLKENQPVTIEVTNRTDRPEVVHWHGLFLPPNVDGAVEEGTPAIAPGGAAQYTLMPRPSGFRWYHTHTMAMNDLTRAQYSGQHGFLMVEPRDNPARYDQEFFLALHDWDGHLFATDDGAMNPSYRAATINGKVMGFGEPLRVKKGQRIVLHILNSSATEVHWLALAGHELRVLALDGNAVPTPRVVPMVRLAPAERVCASVEMNNPGVWVLGEVRKHVQVLGMAIAVEYENARGIPQWIQPKNLMWNYEQFAAEQPLNESGSSRVIIPLVFESRFRGHGSMEAWTINGKSFAEATPTPLIFGQYYRLQFINKSQDDHPVHLHRHSFELRTLGVPVTTSRHASSKAIRGIIKDVLLVDAHTRADVDFVANNPGAALFHCHQQNHMDLGFMMLFDYV